MSINNIASELLLDSSMSIGANISRRLGVVCSNGIQYDSNGISLDQSYMKKNTVNINAASILTLSETPVELVPAQPPAALAQMIYVDKVLIQAIASTTPYAGGSTIVIQYSNISGGGGAPCAAQSIPAATLIDLSNPSGSGFVDCEGGIFNAGGTSRTYVYNGDSSGFGIYLSVLAANFTAGNASLVVTTWYRIV
jgi:hypothetical protein